MAIDPSKVILEAMLPRHISLAIIIGHRERNVFRSGTTVL